MGLAALSAVCHVENRSFVLQSNTLHPFYRVAATSSPLLTDENYKLHTRVEKWSIVDKKLFCLLQTLQ